MSLEEKDIRHVAKLSAIKVSEEELPGLKRDLSDILDYSSRLSEVNTHGVVPTSHVHGVVNAFRDDIIKDSLSVEDVSKNAPDFGSGTFRVPKII